MIARIKWVMLISGALTWTMFYAAIAPQAALLFMFGETLEGSLAEIVDCHLILTIAALSMLVFAALVLANGARYLGQQGGVTIAIDVMAAVIFIIYLLSVSRNFET